MTGGIDRGLAEVRSARGPGWRRANRDDLPLALMWMLGSASALGTLPVLPWLARLGSPCPLRTLTGIPCLTCGSTRAALALGRGDLGAALAVNPLAAIAIVTLFLGGAVAPLWVTWRGPLPRIVWDARARIALAALLGANWLYLVIHRV